VRACKQASRYTQTRLDTLLQNMKTCDDSQ